MTLHTTATPLGANPATEQHPETAPSQEVDAIPIQLGELHFVENKGSEPLEFLIIGVSRDSNRRVDSIDARELAGRRGN